MRQALKSSQGEEDWLQFFKLMSSAIALEEGCPLVPQTPKDPKILRREIKKLASNLRPIERLSNYSQAIQVVEKSSIKAKYYLLELRPNDNTLNVTGYVESQSKDASEAYLDVEKSLITDNGDEAVLVSVDSIEGLRKAYPNYFLDTTAFGKIIQQWTA